MFCYGVGLWNTILTIFTMIVISSCTLQQQQTCEQTLDTMCVFIWGKIKNLTGKIISERIRERFV